MTDIVQMTDKQLKSGFYHAASACRVAQSKELEYCGVVVIFQGQKCTSKATATAEEAQEFIKKYTAWNDSVLWYSRDGVFAGRWTTKDNHPAIVWTRVEAQNPLQQRSATPRNYPGTTKPAQPAAQTDEMDYSAL